MRLLLFIFMILLVGSGCTIKKTGNSTADKIIDTVKEAYPDDNFIEELIEEKIEDFTGLDLDLSSGSEED